MREPNKKCWREKVTAEITLTHLEKIAQEVGAPFTPAETSAFLNHGCFAQGLWVHMMRAGEEYIKSSLCLRSHKLAARECPATRATTNSMTLGRDGLLMATNQ